MSHPSEMSLALLAGGDLGVWARWRMRLHLSGCERCRRELEQFEFSRERLRSAPEEVPGEVNWAPLAAEMKANIHLGLAAGECVGPLGDAESAFALAPGRDPGPRGGAHHRAAADRGVGRNAAAATR